MPDDTPDVRVIECPCCKGKKALLVQDANYPDFPYMAPCCHCGEEGVIPLDNYRLEPING